MEFKGTKGKCELSVPFDGIILIGGNVKAQVLPYSTKGLQLEDKANAVLFSKAPEMLEMLKKAKVELSRIKGSMMAHPDCVQGSEFDDFTNSAEEIENQIENLIKQATEL